MIKWIVISLTSMLLLFLATEWTLNRSAKYKVGDCYSHKELPISIEFESISMGNYYARVRFVFIDIYKDGPFKEIEDAMEGNYQQINCETGKPL